MAKRQWLSILSTALSLFRITEYARARFVPSSMVTNRVCTIAYLRCYPLVIHLLENTSQQRSEANGLRPGKVTSNLTIA